MSKKYLKEILNNICFENYGTTAFEFEKSLKEEYGNQLYHKNDKGVVIGVNFDNLLKAYNQLLKKVYLGKEKI
jgi:hypothetical protein